MKVSLRHGTGCDRQFRLLRSGPACNAPEAQGVSSPAVLSFVEAADKTVKSLHSFMLVRHGHVVAEGWWSPYGAESPHSLYSPSKSFTFTAVGLAIAEGKLGLDDQVLKFFPEDVPSQPSRNLKEMRVSDLRGCPTDSRASRRVRPISRGPRPSCRSPSPSSPAPTSLDNTSGTYMLSAIVQKATGVCPG